MTANNTTPQCPDDPVLRDACVPDGRRLCAHADRDGAGMHWLEAGQTCRSGMMMMMMMIAARQPAAPGTGPAATAPGRWRRTGSESRPPDSPARAADGRSSPASPECPPAVPPAHRSGSAARRAGRRPAAGGAPKCPRTRRCSPTAAAPAPWPAARQRQRHDRARCCGQRRSRHLPASARPPGLPRPGCRGRGVPGRAGRHRAPMAHYPPEHKGGEQAGHKAPTVGRYAASDSRWSKTPDRAIGFIGMLTRGAAKLIYWPYLAVNTRCQLMPDPSQIAQAFRYSCVADLARGDGRRSRWRRRGPP